MRKIVFVLLVYAGSFFILTDSLYAMCIYNETSIQSTSNRRGHAGYRIKAVHDCGWFCSNNWTIESGQKKCRTNTKGKIQVSAECSKSGYTAWSGKKDVEARGYVKVSQDIIPDNRIFVTIYKENDSQASRQEINCN